MRHGCLPLLLLLAFGTPAYAEDPGAPVVTAEAVARKLRDARAFSGQATPVRTSKVSTEFPGLVTSYLARAGNFVKAGQELARLRSTVLEKQLEAAQAELRHRTSLLTELRNGARKEEKGAAQARLDQARAELDLKKYEFGVAERLFKTQTVSRDELHTTELAVRAAQQRVRESEALMALVERGPREERKVQAQANVDAQQAVVDRLEDAIKRHVIVAPFAGYVVTEGTEQGQWVERGDVVTEIVSIESLDIVVPVLEDFVGSLRLRTQVSVRFDALPKRLFEGRIVSIVPRANPRARTFPVKIRIANVEDDGRPVVRAGMFARVQFSVGAQIDAVLVPKDAIVLGGRSPVVYVVDPKTSTVAPVPVELGLAVDGLFQVKGAIEPGTRVVIRGNERLRPGMKVRAQTAKPAAAPGDKR